MRMNGYSLGLRFSKAYENLNEDRPILSAMKMQPNGSRFWQYKVCVDISRGSIETGS